MWIENFRQFLDRSLQRIGEWARGMEFLPRFLVRRRPASAEERVSVQPGFGVGGGKAPFPMDVLPDDWYVAASYRFRSFHCHMRVSILEPTRGMKFIYRALEAPDET